MAWHRKKSNAPSAQTSNVGPEEDEKTVHLQAALSKIKDPMPAVSMVGAVVHADGKVEGLRPVAQDASHKAAPVRQASAPGAASAPLATTQSKPVAEPGSVTPISVPSQPVTTAAQPEAALPVEPAKESSNGPLDWKELTALGDFLKQQKKEPAQSVAAAPVIAPTNPDPEAAIPTHIAHKKKTEEAEAAAAEAKKWHVTKAKIHEKTIDHKRMYRLIGLWIGAIPVAFLLYLLAQALGADKITGIGRYIFIVPIYLIAAYSLVGWIPVMLLYMGSRKD